jgi:hypothetical protein
MLALLERVPRGEAVCDPGCSNLDSAARAEAINRLTAVEAHGKLEGDFEGHSRAGQGRAAAQRRGPGNAPSASDGSLGVVFAGLCRARRRGLYRLAHAQIGRI